MTTLIRSTGPEPEPPSVEPVGVAVVGLGYWGPNLVRNLVELPAAELLAVCDLNPGALAKIAKKYPAVHVTSSFDELLANPAIEALVIATPVSTHHPLAAAALAAGKHVFVEKPLAGSYVEAKDVIDMAESLGLVLMPGHTFLYSPPVNLSLDLINRRELGDIFFITMSRVNLGLHQSDVSVVWDLAPHDFSILRYWLGEVPVRASALTRSCIVPGTPDVAFIDLEFASGTIAHVELSWLAPSKLRRTAIVGSEKMLVYDDTSSEPVRIFNSGADLSAPGTFGEYNLTYRTGDIVSPHLEASEPLSLELADFCNSIRTGSEPRSSNRIGLDVVAMAEAVDRSIAENGQPVEVESNRLAEVS